ncbi:hydantoinase/oxoprolinase family protein [Cupriavidus oxalaticus]|uniref:Hydantoinase/oxoprolinase family protein n=1 Tax=Cupriavidus oxalaticus TaxID=96344 RepID=A0A4P7LUA1_9BURK|nr:hydantoinase/oxoprolinase family protein [Cupriavidus oxalaticus]QBY56197.1 hydantoinase/oxoprolinase family protein [Cupriavidus oxalaticus]
MNKTTRIGVDIGGTFTDFVLHDEARGLTWTGKRLTTPEAPSRAILEGIERLMSETGTTLGQIHSIVHGTTLITNTVLERTGSRVGLLTTDGFRDVLEMGREIRFDVDDLYARPAPVIVQRPLRLGIPGRIRADGSEHQPLDEEAVRIAIRELVERQNIEALAIGFLHSYVNPAHEFRAREIVSEMYPHLRVTLSAEVAPEIREYERITTACVNAYVQPRVHAYLDSLERDLGRIGFDGQLYIMLSSGGITTIDEAKAFPVRLLESGPAAGAMAAAYIAREAGESRVISFDMGGTTAKMCLVEDGQPHIKHEFEAGRLDKFKPGSGLPLKLTVVDMIEISVGGCSIASVDDIGLLKVGPRSAGSVPGPVSYGLGGTEPTVTDSDLLVGYLDPRAFLGGEMQLSVDRVEAAILTRLAQQLDMDTRPVAIGIQAVVTETMAAATRVHMAEKGKDPRAYSMIAFGGAGPVHAYALAKLLKVRRIIIPMGAGVISAFGFLITAPAVNDVRGYVAPLKKVDWARVSGLYAEMEARAVELLRKAGGDELEIELTRSADMRYLGQGFEVEVIVPNGELAPTRERAISEAFSTAYASQFGRVINDVPVEIVNWRLSARVPGSRINLAYSLIEMSAERGKRNIHFAEFGDVTATVYDRYALRPGAVIAGPAVFEERESSFSVGPDCTVTVDQNFNLVADIEASEPHDASTHTTEAAVLAC